jgi:hypothetical protein
VDLRPSNNLRSRVAGAMADVKAGAEMDKELIYKHKRA